MEEDIKILEDKLKLNATTKFDWFGEKEFKAIENLINRNKELKEENESLVRQYEYQGALMVNEYFSKKQVLELFIPKSKVKEKIEWLEKNIIDNPYSRGSDLDNAEYQIDILQELLEE